MVVTAHALDREATVAAPSTGRDETDLNEYQAVLWRWRGAIVVASVATGLTVLALSFVLRPTYEAEAAVAIVKSGSQLNFDPRFKTISEADQQMQLTDQAARRKSLTSMAMSLDIAGAVIAKIGDRLEDAERRPGALLRTLNVRNEGDLIQIRARANSPELAALIANTWAQEYESRVNNVYGDSSLSVADMQSQTEAAKHDYDAREAAFIAYVANDPAAGLTRRIAENRQVLTSLASSREVALQAIVAKKIEFRSKLVAQYLSAESDGLLLGFAKEQEGKTKLLSSYLDATISSRLAAFNEQLAARQQKLKDLYAIHNKLDRLLADAAALYTRLSSEPARGSRGTDLAAILLEASAFSTWSSLPVRLQIPVDQLTAPNSTPAERLRNLNTLITTLKDRRHTVQADIDKQSKELVNNAGYSDIDASAFGQDPLTDSVKKQYPSLFTLGELAHSPSSIAADNPLSRAVDEQSKAIAQVRDLEDLIPAAAPNEALSKAIGEIEQRVNQTQAELEQANAKKQELTRARDLAWSSYTTLANKLAEVVIASQTRSTVVRQAVPAVPPERPVAPKKALNAVVGSMLGLMIGVGFAFYREYADDTIRNEEQATKLLGLPTIGAIPALPPTSGRARSRRDGHVGLVVQDMRSAATESFRLLRHHLLASGTPWKVLLVASAWLEEGKSTVAANLAVLLARSGKRVTLLDADFRCPAQHRIFGLDNGRGLSDILGGSSDDWDVCSQLQADGLRIVPSGPLPADPTLLLQSPHLSRCIERIKTISDVVIVDTPATLGLADAVIAAGVVDAILLVLRANTVSRQDAVRAKEQLAAAGVPILGVVLNRTERLSGASTHGYDATPEGRSASLERWRMTHLYRAVRRVAVGLRTGPTDLPS